MTHDDSFCLVLLYLFYDIGSGLSPGSRYPTIGFIVDMFHNIHKFAIWQKLKAMVFLFLCPPTKIVIVMDVHPGQTYYFGISDFDLCSFFVSWLQEIIAKCPEVLSCFNIVFSLTPALPYMCYTCTRQHCGTCKSTSAGASTTFQYRRNCLAPVC